MTLSNILRHTNIKVTELKNGRELETANLVLLFIKKNTMLVFEERLKMPVDSNKIISPNGWAVSYTHLTLPTICSV